MTAATVTPLRRQHVADRLAKHFTPDEYGSAAEATIRLARAGGLLDGGVRFADLPDEVVDRLAGDVRIVADAFTQSGPVDDVELQAARRQAMDANRRTDRLADELIDVMADRQRLRDLLAHERANAVREIALLRDQLDALDDGGELSGPADLSI